MNEMLGADLVEVFREGLRWSKVQEGEPVLIYADTNLPWPEYVPAAFAAAAALKAEPFVLTGPSRAIDVKDRLVVDAWKNAGLAIHLARPGVNIYSHAHNEILESGTRVLAIRQRQEALRAMFPDQAMIDRAYAYGERLKRAREMRVTSAAGTDLLLRKDDRKVHVQVGVSDAPGMWDNLGSAQVSSGPIESATQGTYVIAPGDILMNLRRHVTRPIKLTYREGRVVEVEGGAEADLLQDYLSRGRGPDAYRVAHAGWGLHRGADWNNPWSQDAESFYGNVMISLGSNIFTTPHPWRGYGGANDCGIHLDICCRNMSLYLDGELVVEEGILVGDSVPAEPRRIRSGEAVAAG